MVTDGFDANRPLSFVLAGQSIQRTTLVTPVRHHYNHDQPSQALHNQTPVEAVLN